MNAPMNETATTEGGYANSKMATETLPSLVSNEGIIGKSFGSHILEYSTLLSNRVNKEAINQSGGRSLGASDEWDWYTRKIDLMSEINVYGATVTSSSIYDTGIDNMQYALFQQKPEIKYSHNKEQLSYWLKDVVSSEKMAVIYHKAAVSSIDANSIMGVRPRFLIG